MKKLLPALLLGLTQLVCAQPTSWKITGIGGGGAFFRPSINPGNPDEYYVPTDMGSMFHTTNYGNSYTELDFRQPVGGAAGIVRFTNNPAILYGIGNGSVYKTIDGGVSWVLPNGIKNPVSPELSNSIASLWVNYSNPNQLVVSTGNGIFYSSDGAASFIDLKNQITFQSGISQYACGCFFDGNAIYLGTNQGVLVSTDAGVTWSRPSLTGIASGEDIFGFAAAKQSGIVRFYCITGAVNGVMNAADIQLAAGGNYNLLKGVYTLDYSSSTTWVSKLNGITMPVNNCYPCDHINWLGMAENDINTAYLYGGNGNSEPTVLKTVDGGANWSRVFNITNNQNIYTGYFGYKGDCFLWYLGNAGMSVCATDANRVVLANMGSVYKTASGGTTWEQGYDNPADQNAPGAPTPKHKAYRGVGIENTTNWFVHWFSQNEAMGCLTDIGSIRTTDGGTYWSFGTFSFNTMYHAVQAPGSSTVYCAASDKHDMYSANALQDAGIDDPSYITGKVLSSGDNGYSWNVIHDFGRPVYWLAFDPNNYNTMYASVVNHKQAIGGIWVTKDLQNGASSTWTQLSAPPRTEGHPATIVPLKDGKVICTYGPRMTDYNASPGGKFTRSSGVFMYNPGNNSWTDLTDLSTMGWYCNDLYVDPTDATQSTWYVGVASGWGWTDAAGNVTPNDQGGLFKTTDRGQTWKKLFGTSDVLSPGGGVMSCTINPSDPNQLYVCTTRDGLLLSKNCNAANPVFANVKSFQFGAPIRALFNPYKPTELWVTTFGNGLHIGDVGTTGVPQFAENKKLQVYPNPAANEFIVHTAGLDGILRVRNLLGEEIQTIELKNSSNNYVLNSESWVNGIYFVSTNQYTEKLIISK